MKIVVLSIAYFVFSLEFSYGQKDSITIAKTGFDSRPIEWVVIINNYVILDTAISYPFLKEFADKIIRRKGYSATKGYKKFGIVSKDGILHCFLKPRTEIDFKKWGITENSKLK